MNNRCKRFLWQRWTTTIVSLFNYDGQKHATNLTFCMRVLYHIIKRAPIYRSQLLQRIQAHCILKEKKNYFSCALKVTEFYWIRLATTIDPKALVLRTRFTVFCCSSETVKHLLVNLTTIRTLSGNVWDKIKSNLLFHCAQFIGRNIGQVTS